ncbi:MAG TPA: hypothetical protein PLM98_02230, partial [Thiolinea sp.]|nr:hypothetical protein [Thiolinea sp.]
MIVMKDRFKLKLLTGCLLACLSLTKANAGLLEEQRELFRTAYTAIQANKLEDARLVMPKLQGYPLASWLQAQFLIADFDQTSDATLAAFIANNPNALISDSLAARLAERLAAQGNWPVILQLIPDNPEQLTTQCYRIQALLNTGLVNQGLEKAKKLWQSTKKDFPSDCLGMLRQLQSNQVLNNSDYWQRVSLLIANNRLSAARNLVPFLNE